MSLKKSRVQFSHREHTYKLEDKCLSGITSLLSKHVFPDKYESVPKYILNRAAQRGTDIHELCEFYDKFGIIDDAYPEIKNYADLIEKNKIEIIETEYLISDNEHFATMIDRVDKDFNLYDIKTTSVLDKEYLSWQLSINAYLFELQNGFKSGKLFGIWLKGERAELIEVPRIDDEVIKYLFDCELSGKEFINPLRQISQLDNVLLTKISDLEQSIIIAETELKTLQNRQKEFKNKLMDLMDDRGIENWETDLIKITRKKDSVRERLDSKSIKENYPEIYKENVKQSTVKGSILITIK